MGALYLSQQQWNNRIKSIETKNLREYHTTPSWLTIARAFNDCIIEYQIGNNGLSTIVIDEQKYKMQRKICLSEEFAMGQLK